jgi:hypothetical protein
MWFAWFLPVFVSPRLGPGARAKSQGQVPGPVPVPELGQEVGPEHSSEALGRRLLCPRALCWPAAAALVLGGPIPQLATPPPPHHHHCCCSTAIAPVLWPILMQQRSAWCHYAGNTYARPSVASYA